MQTDLLHIRWYGWSNESQQNMLLISWLIKAQQDISHLTGLISWDSNNVCSIAKRTQFKLFLQAKIVERG